MLVGQSIFFLFSLIQVMNGTIIAYRGHLSIIYSDSGPPATISVSGTSRFLSYHSLSLFLLFVRGEP